MVDKTVTAENAAGAIQLSDMFRGVQNGLTVKYTFDQVKTFVESFSDEVMTASGLIAGGSSSLIIPVPANCDILNIDLTDVQVSVNSQLVMTISVNGGSVFLSTGYLYGIHIMYTSAPVDDIFAVGDPFMYLTANTLAGPAGISASIRIPHPNSNVHHKRFHVSSLYKAAAGANAMFNAHGAVEIVSPITHIKIAPLAGTFVAGTYLVRAGKK